MKRYVCDLCGEPVHQSNGVIGNQYKRVETKKVTRLNRTIEFEIEFATKVTAKMIVVNGGTVSYYDKVSDICGDCLAKEGIIFKTP